VSQGAGDWETALTLAVAGAQGAENFNIIIYSDGNFGDINAQLPETVNEPIFIPIGTGNNNLALDALAVRSIANDTPQLFAQVTNYSDQSADASLVIRLDGELWQSQTQTIAPLSQRAFIYAVDQPFITASAELVYDDAVRDDLSLDDRAWTIASESRTRRVLLLAEGGNRFLEQALASIAGVQTFRGDTTRPTLPDTLYDLYVFDGYLPDVLPDGDMLIVNPPRDNELFTLGETLQDVGAWRISEPDHPLTAFLDVDAVNLRAYRQLNTTWGETLIRAENRAGARGEALLYAGENDGRQIAILPFDLRASDLPLQLAFPIFIANALEWYSPANILDNTRPFAVGATINARPPVDATSLRLTQPDDSQRTIPIEGAGVVLTDTHQVGLYTLDILRGDDVLESVPFAVTLFGTGESNIAPQASITLGGATADTTGEEQFSWREYWEWLALGALLVLMWEWWVYYRRLRAPQLARVQTSRTTARR
jgi:Ca-activated chloride channel family protein